MDKGSLFPWIGTLLTLVGLGISILNILIMRSVRRQDQSKGMQTQIDALRLLLHTEIDPVKERCALLEMKMGMFWRLCEEYLSGMLKKPIHLRMDTLLDKLAKHTITLEECYELRAEIQDNYLNKSAADADKQLMPIAILVTGAVESLIQELERQ